MTKNVTVEIVSRKTYQIEVPDDFDFENTELLNDTAADIENNTAADTEDWEEIIFNDDDEGGYYVA